MNGLVARALRRLGLVVLLLAAGCGKSAVVNPRVEGTVTIDGAPLAQVLVQFIPEPEAGVTAPAAAGFTDAAGHFQLTHDNQKPGAALGKHRVIVLQGRGGANPDDPDAPPVPPPPGPQVPSFYTLSGQTPLRVEVSEAQHTYDLILATRAGGGGKDSGK